jgi:hypothetical protein
LSAPTDSGPNCYWPTSVSNVDWDTENGWSEFTPDLHDLVDEVLELKEYILELFSDSSALNNSVIWDDLLCAIEVKLYEFGRDPDVFPYGAMSAR